MIDELRYRKYATGDHCIILFDKIDKTFSIHSKDEDNDVGIISGFPNAAAAIEFADTRVNALSVDSKSSIKVVVKTMKTNAYLYGEDIEVEEIPAEVILSRVVPLEEHFDEILEIPLEVRTYEQIVQMGEIAKAIKFWENINSKERG